MNLLEKVKFVRILTPKVLIRKIFFKLIRLFRNRFELIKIQFKPTYIVKQNKKPDFLPFVQTIEELFESLKFDDYLENNRTLVFELADNYLNHKFNLLGSGWTKVSHHEEYNGFSGIKYLNIIHIDKNKFSEVFIKKANRNYSRLIFSEIPENYVLIDWQRDFRSGYRWSELEPSKLIRYGNLKGVDIKNPWEIGRMQHLILFFYSWKMSNNNLYADEFQNQILDFIASNPPYMGVQWQNAMEPSIRVSNWILVFCLFYANGYQFDDKFIKILIISINDHISFIENNLEWSGGLRGNHYFSNLSGLIIAKLFLGYEKNLQNLELLINSILEEIDYQFMNDGGNF